MIIGIMYLIGLALLHRPTLYSLMYYGNNFCRGVTYFCFMSSSHLVWPFCHPYISLHINACINIVL